MYHAMGRGAHLIKPVRWRVSWYRREPFIRSGELSRHEIVIGQNVLVEDAHGAGAAHLKIVELVALRICELRKSGGDVNKAICQKLLGGWIVPVVRAMAFQPIWAEVLHTLVLQPKRRNCRCCGCT